MSRPVFTPRADPEYETAVARAVAERISAEIELGGFDDMPASAYRPAFGIIGAPEAQIRIAAWNNWPGREHSAVLALLDAAIARQRARVSAG